MLDNHYTCCDSIIICGFSGELSVVHDNSPSDDRVGVVVSACNWKDDVGRHGFESSTASCAFIFSFHCYNVRTCSVVTRWKQPSFIQPCM